MLVAPILRGRLESLFFGEILRIKDLMIGKQLNRVSARAVSETLRPIQVRWFECRDELLVHHCLQTPKAAALTLMWPICEASGNLPPELNQQRPTFP